MSVSCDARVRSCATGLERSMPGSVASCVRIHSLWARVRVRVRVRIRVRVRVRDRVRVRVS